MLIDTSRGKTHHVIQVWSRMDYFLELIFEDYSVRAIDLAIQLGVDKARAIAGEPNTRRISIHPEGRSIIWDDGTEISANFLYSNGQLVGWADENPGRILQTVRPVQFSRAEIRIQIFNHEVKSSLLLDGEPRPALRISSAWFGIYENIPWYHVPFPGDDGIYEPEWEEPQIMFDTLQQLVQMANSAVAQRKRALINITDVLRKADGPFYVQSLSPRYAAIFADHYRRNIA